MGEESWEVNHCMMRSHDECIGNDGDTMVGGGDSVMQCI